VFCFVSFPVICYLWFFCCCDIYGSVSLSLIGARDLDNGIKTKKSRSEKEGMFLIDLFLYMCFMWMQIWMWGGYFVIGILQDVEMQRCWKNKKLLFIYDFLLMQEPAKELLKFQSINILSRNCTLATEYNVNAYSLTLFFVVYWLVDCFFFCCYVSCTLCLSVYSA